MLDSMVLICEMMTSTIKQTNSVSVLGDETCYFIGKSIHSTAITDDAAIEVLLPLLQEYAKSLRPRDLAGIISKNDRS